jgi:hypothetical protein
LPALAAAADPVFSHKVHLQRGIACATCHASARTSSTMKDNNLPGAAVCADCHSGAAGAPRKLDGADYIGKPRQVFLRDFNHELHLKFGNIAPLLRQAVQSGKHLDPAKVTVAHLQNAGPCEACHRGLRESDRASHANMPAMADCLVCHDKIDPPFSCEKCHTPGVRLTPASHKPGWLDEHSKAAARAAANENCAVCHGKQFTCLGCH